MGSGDRRRITDQRHSADRHPGDDMIVDRREERLLDTGENLAEGRWKKFHGVASKRVDKAALDFWWWDRELVTVAVISRQHLRQRRSLERTIPNPVVASPAFTKIIVGSGYRIAQYLISLRKMERKFLEEGLPE